MGPLALMLTLTSAAAASFEPHVVEAFASYAPIVEAFAEHEPVVDALASEG